MNRSASTLLLLVFALSLPVSVSAQTPPLFSASARSVSGQFIVLGAQQVSPLVNSPAVLTNAEYVRVEPALLAVTAERVKDSVGQQLGIDDSKPWRGQIFLALHPAQSLDEDVRIISTRLGGVWNYRVELPDVLTRLRLTRALTAVVLLEYANRTAGEHSAEMPSWLVDGMSQQVLASGLAGFILSAPAKIVNNVREHRIVAGQSGVNLLVGAHQTLQDRSALTFEQLSWPTSAQLDGADGGVYRASAQLFVDELLDLKNGAKELRAMLQLLPRYYNWQLAFREAFRADFPRTIDLEKWWALQVVAFAAEDIGPMWTPAASLDRLNTILNVPVEFRSASNNLPTHAEVSLQDAIRNFDPERRTVLLQTKMRDLAVAQLRMSPQLAVLCDGYRRVLAGYLGQKPLSRKVVLIKGSPVSPSRTGERDTLKKLDELDAQRRAISENSPKPALARP